jgi:16S rRNA (guanine966-N2)-methyltransferase
MRIISGRFGGRRLVSFDADHIRPTTDRIKESLFNKLQGAIEGASVLDLFSGTGNLSIEALSRGATRVVAVEMNRKSVDIIRKNLALLEIADEIEVHSQDVFKFLRGYKGPAFDIILADPPFTQSLGDDVVRSVADSLAMDHNSTFVTEVSSREKIAASYEGLKNLDDRDYGDKRVIYWQREEK